MISLTSTSAGCSMAKAMARAIASGGIAMLSRAFRTAPSPSDFFTPSAKFVRTKPGEIDGHAHLAAGLLPQPFGDHAHRDFGRRSRPTGWARLVGGGRGGVDEVPDLLLAEDRQRGGDADSTPLMFTSTIRSQSSTRSSSSGDDRHHARVADEHVEPAEPLAGQRRRAAHVVTPLHVDRGEARRRSLCARRARPGASLRAPRAPRFAPRSAAEARSPRRSRCSRR